MLLMHLSAQFDIRFRERAQYLKLILCLGHRLKATTRIQRVLTHARGQTTEQVMPVCEIHGFQFALFVTKSQSTLATGERRSYGVVGVVRLRTEVPGYVPAGLSTHVGSPSMLNWLNLSPEPPHQSFGLSMNSGAS
ncbi:hypothetical protein GTC6_05542 [Gordonia terrae C-6]|uniref:Uncharacterized protein n=1 Tax=Gordonia terrae C-6 TaxID=1316928 RepID=R7YCP1_9ACTN|nr:hypothetical protein GTC6_05542 [Gordonia terrae C-6]